MTKTPPMSPDQAAEIAKRAAQLLSGNTQEKELLEELDR